MKRTTKDYQFFGEGLIITDSKIWLNKSDECPEGKDYRVATLSIQLNNSLWLNNVKIFENSDETKPQYRIQLPGSYIKTRKDPEGKWFDHVRMSNDQFATLRNYCYDRLREAQEAGLEPVDTETEPKD